jgi:hypothetical protein
MQTLSAAPASVAGYLNWKKTWICPLVGGFGVLSGFALFIDTREEGLNSHFLIGLLVATVVAYFIEYLREIIGPHHSDGEQEHRSLPGVGVSVFMLLVFELFVAAWHEIGKGPNWNMVHEAAIGVLGKDLAHETSAWWHLGVLVGLWVLAGAALTWSLSCVIVSKSIDDGSLSNAGLPRRVFNGARIGVCASIAAPLAVLGWVLLVQFISWIYWMFNDYAGWQAHLDDVVQSGSSWTSVALPLWYVSHFVGSLWIKISLGVAAVWIVCLLLRHDPKGKHLATSAISLLAVSFVGIAMAPLLENLGLMLMLALLTFVAWLVPAALLGALMPLLEAPSESRKAWSGIAFLAAVALVGVTILRIEQSYWLILLACPLLVFGLLFLRGVRIENFWPVLALSVAIILFGSTQLLQATFGGVLHRFHAALSQPQELGRNNAVSGGTPESDYFEQLRRETRQRVPHREIPPAKSLKDKLQLDLEPEKLLNGNLTGAVRPVISSKQERKPDPAPAQEVVQSQDAEADNPARVWLLLEVAITSSVGFWATVGLLAAWAISKGAGAQTGRGLSRESISPGCTG